MTQHLMKSALIERAGFIFGCSQVLFPLTTAYLTTLAAATLTTLTKS